LKELLTQFGPLAQSLGSEDWANLLFIVVMAALWLVAGLVKALGKKKSQQEPRELNGLEGQRPSAGEGWQQRLARRAEELQRRLEQEAGLGQSRRPQAPAHKTPDRSAQAPPGGRLTIRPGRGGQSVLVYERPDAPPPAPPPPEPELARQRQLQETMAAMKDSVGPVVRHVSEFTPGGPTPLTAGPLQPLSEGMTQTKAPRQSPGSESGTIIDYDDPEALKKAILQYEILGKPLALRDASDEKTAF
jgi:hypothetical protein